MNAADQAINFSVTFTSYLATDDALNATATRETETTLPQHIIIGRYFSICLIFVAAYVFISLTVYSFKNWHATQVSKVNHLTVFCAFCAVCISALKCSEQWQPFLSCIAIHWMETSVYVAGTVVVYTVLWARQRKLYSDERLASSTSRPLRIGSSVLIIFIYVTISITSFLFASRYSFEREYFPCIIVWRSLQTLYPVTIAFMTACFVFQVVLFILLIYPLTRGKETQGKRRFFLCEPSANDIERTARRLAYCVCACISSTFCVSILVLLDTTPSITVHWCNFATVDLLVNTVAATCSLVNWKQRLFSLFLTRRTFSQ